jgi:pSer/pThr/pTyr-binding forkhead associated (FHA) protein
MGNIAAVTTAPANPDETVLGEDRTAPLPRVGVRERARAASSFPKPAPGRHLAIEDGEQVVLVALDRPVLHLGRSTSADIVLDHATVSRRHAVIAEEGDGMVLLDDRSRNGVLLNGEQVSRASLRDGDVIQLGSVVMRFLDRD